MHFVTASEHIHFFSQKRFIEFEDLLSAQEAAMIQERAEQILTRRLKIKPEELSFIAPLDVFMSGRNLWAEDPVIKKILFRPMFGKIATDLFRQTSLRLAYDQLYLSTENKKASFQKPATLQYGSCIKRIVGGMAIRLCDDPIPLETSDDFCPFPQKAGSVMFLSPEIQLSFNSFFQRPHRALLLVAYCSDRAVYTLDNNDPFTHAPKKEGYVFGDLLADKTNPIIFR